jgi:hypothetical protein
MIRPTPLRVIWASLLCAATAGSYACISNGTTTPQLEDGGLPLEDSGLIFEDGEVILPDGAVIILDGGLVVVDGAVTVLDGASVLNPANAPAPDYTTDLSSVVLKNDVHSKVSTISGTVNLDFHTVGGSAYEVFHDQNLSGAWSFAAIDGLWAANASRAVAIPAGSGNVAIAATSLLSIGDTLPESGGVVVMSQGDGNVTTYEVLPMTFAPH